MQKRLAKIVVFVGIVVVLAINLMPTLWTILASFKSGNEIYLYPPPLLPSAFNLQNYVRALSEYRLDTALKSSIIVSTSATLLILVFGALSAYSHSRFKFRGNAALFMLVLVLRMVPPITVMVPLYNLGRILGLLNTFSWLILLNVAFNLPTAIWIFKVFFDNIPTELLDAAKIDGCGNIASFTRIIVPLSKPTAAVVTVLIFVGIWNEFLMARTFAFGANLRTLPVALEPIIGVGTDVVGVHWGHVAASATLIVLPLLPIAVFFQKYLVSGMMGGAVKG